MIRFEFKLQCMLYVTFGIFSDNFFASIFEGFIAIDHPNNLSQFWVIHSSLGEEVLCYKQAR